MQLEDASLGLSMTRKLFNHCEKPQHRSNLLRQVLAAQPSIVYPRVTIGQAIYISGPIKADCRAWTIRLKGEFQDGNRTEAEQVYAALK